MSFAAPLLTTAGGVAAGAGRTAAFSIGAKSLMPGRRDDDMPIPTPQKAAIDDVEGISKRTVNPNSVL